MRDVKAEQNTAAPHKGRGKELAPLGAKVKDLQVGEHISIDYPRDSTPSMADAIRHYRSLFKLNLHYRQIEPGKYDIWRATLDFERKSKLSTFSQQLDALQIGQRISIDYPPEATPAFSMKIAKCRQYLEKPFQYLQLGIGRYEVWLGTAEDVAKDHRGTRHVQTALTEDELKKLQNNRELGRDWVTVVLLAMRCGISVRFGRRLKWKQVFLDDKQVEVQTNPSAFPVRRNLPDDLLKHLWEIRPANADGEAPVCPVLAGTPNKKFQDSWPKVRKLLGLAPTRSLNALTWPWKKANPGLPQKEIALNHIAALERKWLSAAELTISAKIGALAENIVPLPNPEVECSEPSNANETSCGKHVRKTA